MFLELGGKSAFVILDDADLRGACATAAFTVCTHAGQGCAITTRLLVPRRQFDEAVESTAKVMGKLPAGDPTDPGTICGPLISARQRDRVEGYLALAWTRAARWSSAADVPRGSTAASSSSPPSSSGWTTGPGWPRRRSSGRCWWSSPTTATTTPWPGQRLGLRVVRLGVVGRPRTGPSTWPAASAPAPSGSTAGCGSAPTSPSAGYKQSGLGRESGVAGFEEYLETKSMAEPA